MWIYAQLPPIFFLRAQEHLARESALPIQVDNKHMISYRATYEPRLSV